MEFTRYGIGEVQRAMGIGRVIDEAHKTQTPIVITRNGEDLAFVMPVAQPEARFVEYCLERYRAFWTVVGIDSANPKWLEAVLAEEILGEMAKKQRQAVERKTKTQEPSLKNVWR